MVRKPKSQGWSWLHHSWCWNTSSTLWYRSLILACIKIYMKFIQSLFLHFVWCFSGMIHIYGVGLEHACVFWERFSMQSSFKSLSSFSLFCDSWEGFWMLGGLFVCWTGFGMLVFQLLFFSILANFLGPILTTRIGAVGCWTFAWTMPLLLTLTSLYTMQILELF